MRRTLLAPLLIAIVSLGLLAACGGGDPTPTPVTQLTADLPLAEGVTPEAPPPSLGDALFPSRDVTLYEDEEGSVANSRGSFIFVGVTNRRELRRSLIAFDVAESVPEGATVTGVRLTLSMSRTAGPENNISLHRALAAWDEGPSATVGQGGAGATAMTGDPTWVHSSFDTERWASVGGDFEPVASATTTVVDTGSYVWEGAPKLVADVQSWVDDPSTNFGWALIGDEDSAKPTKRFDSREHDNESNRPLLVIDFTTP